MILNTTAFSKAAKRLASADQSTLSQAQEKLSSILGFSNYDAARKALIPKVEVPATVVTSNGYNGRKWMGLEYNEVMWLMKALCFHTEKNTPIRWGNDSWQSKSFHLMKVVFLDVFGQDTSAPVTASEMMTAFNIESMCSRYASMRKKGEIPLISRGFTHYLDFLPGFRMDLCEKKGGQYDIVKEQHSYLTSYLIWGLQGLSIIEIAGRSNQHVEKLFSEVENPIPDMVTFLIEQIESDVRFKGLK